jgi:Tfp pilus assembly protein FimT
MKTNLRRGLSLLEAVIASAILAVMVLGTYTLYSSGMSASEEGSIRNGLDNRCRQTLDRLREELQLCRVLAVNNNFIAAPVYLDHTGIQFRVPMGVVGGVATYGYRDGSNVQAPVLNRSAILRFVVSEQVRENLGVFLTSRLPAIPPGTTQTTMNWDLNGDGDRTDVWVFGRIELVFVDAAGVITGTRSIIEGICLKGTTAFPQDLDGDVDGDGIADPLFTALDGLGVEVTNATITNARKLRASVIHAHLDQRRRRLIFRRASEEIRLENTQS